MELKTVQDLIFYYPFRYEDFSNIVPIGGAKINEQITVVGKISSIENRRTRWKNKPITECFVEDESGALKAVWFNQPFLTKNLKAGDLISLSGKITINKYGTQMQSPQYEQGSQMGANTGILAPVYSLTQNLTQKQMRFLVKQSLAAVTQIQDYLPEDLKKSQNLCGLHEALKNIHFPFSKTGLKKAEQRLKFDELFLLQIKAHISRSYLKQYKAPKLKFHENETKAFVSGLAFTLTNAQKKSAWEILKDMENDSPMNRLLEGDVGSGKTVVSAISILNCVLNGYQTIIMVPTEILAKQHFGTFCKLFANYDISIELWTRTQKKLKIKNQESKTRNGKSHESSIIIGTHALIQEDVSFKDIGLVIIDEQHRFGVEQRKKLIDKTPELRPHFLSMTATPIPRSLALAVYGDLDISIIDEMPKGRKKIITKVVSSKKRADSYAFIEEQIRQGRQVFVICPLIEESDVLGVKAVTTEHEKLHSKIFPNFKIGLLHGKLKSAEKNEVQEKFAKGDIDILVATSVVEVGVNVPNASVMMIEGAERFGLAQLHQFRGRVGRSGHQSHCFLFSDNAGREIWARLKHLENTNDGFKLAEIDLKIRGSGELYGTRQSGLPELKIATLHDYPLLKKARDLALSLIENSGYEKYPRLAEKIEEMKESMHLE